METKICKDPDCEHKGEAQPMDSFQESHHRRNMQDTRLDTCRDCMARKRKAGHKKAKIKVPESSQSVPETPEPKRETRNLKLELDFTGHPKVLKKIREIAADDIRTPEAQVLYWLKEFTLLKENA